MEMTKQLPFAACAATAPAWPSFHPFHSMGKRLAFGVPSHRRTVACRNGGAGFQAYGGSSLSAGTGNKNLYDFLGLKFEPLRIA